MIHHSSVRLPGSGYSTPRLRQPSTINFIRTGWPDQSVCKQNRPTQSETCSLSNWRSLEGRPIQPANLHKWCAASLNLLWRQSNWWLNIPFSPTNGKDHVNTSMKFGSQYGCGEQLNCWIFITKSLFSYFNSVSSYKRKKRREKESCYGYVVVQFFPLAQFFLNWYRIHWTGTIVIVLVYFHQLSKKRDFPFFGV